MQAARSCSNAVCEGRGSFKEDILRGIFEGSANRGWKTRERFDSPAWGFYEIKSEDHYQEGYGGVRVEPVKYVALVGMDHHEKGQDIQ